MVPATRAAVDRGSIQHRALALRDFRVSVTRFPAELFLASHYHEYGCLTLMFEGSLRERLPGRALECEAGLVLIKPPGERHDDRFGPKGSAQVIVESGFGDHDVIPEISAAYASARLIKSRVAMALGRRIRAELSTRDRATALCVEGLVLELLGELTRSDMSSGPAIPAWLLRVRDMLCDDPLSDTGVSRLASEAGVPPVFLARQFRRHFGQSLGAFARRQRLLWSAEQVAGSDRPLVDIALEAGFADQSHFTRSFARQFGVPPRTFRLRTAR